MIYPSTHTADELSNCLKQRNTEMAAFDFSDINQRDTMHTLYLKEQHAYSEPPVTGNRNMLYMNYPFSSPHTDMLGGNTDSQLNCFDLPASHDSSVVESVASRVGDPSYNMLKDGGNEMLFYQTIGLRVVHNSITGDPQMDLQTPPGILNGQNLSLQQADISAVQGQGLSLSLSTQIPVSSFQYPPASSDTSVLTSPQSISGNDESCRDDDSRNRFMDVNLSPYALSHLTSSIPNSKYLKAAQQLLDEVVNIQKTLKHKSDKSHLNASGTTSCKGNDGVSNSDTMPLKPQESTTNSSSVFLISERQDLQNKLTKILAMLDEVDRRYKKYYHQMQIVVSSFDVIAGSGAAKSYTALALQTISQQYRNLRDAINSQIRSTRNSLGEQDNSSTKGGVITRLRCIDQHLRQQRAIQQLGIYQQHSWRPQRGLPENSVSTLRSWLFEHFLNPYPTDSEKLMLARQTGLTRSQISNWFINARVRLWKPMIEEMYKEEFDDIEIDSSSLSENATKGRDEIRSSKEREDQSSTVEGHHINQLSESPKSNYITNTGMRDAATSFQNSTKAGDAYMNLKSRDQRNEGDCSLLHNALDHSDGSARFMTCQMTELAKYGNSGVSLTLGLQHCDGTLPMLSSQTGFLALRGEGMYSAAPPLRVEVADYDCINLEDQRHRIGSPHFVS